MLDSAAAARAASELRAAAAARGRLSGVIWFTAQVSAKARARAGIQSEVNSLGRHHWSAPARPVALAILLLCSLACDTAVQGQYGSGAGEVAPPPPRPDPGGIDNGAPYTTRLSRLTHSEYDQTASDLLGLDVRVSSEFLDDPTYAGFDNNADALRVSGRLGRDYRRAAEQLAERVATSSELLDALSPCGDISAACAEEFVSSLGLRAFRRPLTDVELARYVALFDAGAGSGAGDSELADAVQWVLEGMLQSPHFLYRVELSSVEDEDGFVPLDNYELATRLSYMLTGSMPDAELFEAAAERDLGSAEVLREQAERLVREPSVSRRVLDFHEQWLDLSSFENSSKDSDLFPEFTPDLLPDYREEVRRFVEATTLDDERGLKSLLSTPASFVNQRTAGFYGLDAADFGADFERVEFRSGERAGLLTQLGFLASHAYTTDTSPIHRGVFVLRQILCQDLPDPPGDIDLTLPEPDGEVVTTRDQIELHTSPAACKACHSLINPIGFAFEHYDAVGRYRAEDNGAPIDAAGSLELESDHFQFENALELLPQIAESQAARSCYATQWLRYAYGRSVSRADEQTLARLSESLADDDYSVRALLVDLTEPRAFTHRAPTERQ